MKLKLLDQEKTEALESIQRFLSEEVEVEVSAMQAEFILEFFSKELAPLAYNQGIEDAQKFLMMKAEDLGGTCFEEALTYWKHSSPDSELVRRRPSP